VELRELRQGFSAARSPLSVLQDWRGNLETTNAHAVRLETSKLQRYQWYFFSILAIIVGARILVYFIDDPLASVIARNLFNEARSIAAALACFIAARLNHTINPSLSRAWYIISFSFWGWIIGIFLHFLTELQGESVVGTIVDLPYLAFYPVFLFGVLQLPTPKRTRDDWISLAFDLAIVLVSAFLVVWVLAIRHQLNQTSNIFPVISAIAYAFGDMLLIWGAFYILVGLSTAIGKRVQIMLALGAVILFSTDMIYVWQVRQGNYATTNLIGFGWTFGLVSFAVAGALAWIPHDTASRKSTSPGVWLQLSGAVSIILSTVCLAFSLVIAWLLQDPLNNKVTILAIVVLFLLVIGRQIAGARILTRLRTLLLDINTSLENRVFERTQQLVLERDRANAILASVQDAIIIHDLDGHILEVNPAMLAMYGFDRHQIVGLSIEDISSTDNPLREIHEQWRHLAVGHSQRFNWQAKHADGTSFPVDVVLTRSEFNVQPVLVACIRDMSEHTHLQEQLLRSQRLEAIGKLAGGMAHDFNNILVPILGYSELLLLKIPANGPEHNSVLQIAKAAKLASGLTKQLLSFGRNAALEVTVFNLNALINGFEKMLCRLIREDIQLIFSLEPGLANISGDRFQIEQVLMNLVVNARDALPNGGTILIETKNAAVESETLAPDKLPTGQIVLKVSDNGIGMPPEVQARLFEPFFTTKEVGHGTGLGLSTVFGVVQQHKGTIQVESTPNVGSTFTIGFPRCNQEVTKAIISVNKTHFGGGRIFVVEDNESVRLFVTQALHHHGYETITSDNPVHALKFLAEPLEKIDLLLSDVIMPEMNGYAFVQHARELRPAIPVLLMTAYVDEVIAGMPIHDNSIPILQKPFSTDDLVTKINELIAS
jgi:two-component system, cell cycle sensor histidine kinase and response regulator CckA